MTARSSSSGRSNRAAASLAAIKLRRGDSAATLNAKSGNLTEKLQQPLAPVAATVERAPPPAAAHPEPAPQPRAPAETPIPTNATTVRVLPLAPAQPAPVVYADAQGAKALRSYWEQLRGRDDVPFYAGLNINIVATSWPNSLLVSYNGTITMPQITRIGRHTGEIEYTSMVTEWILSCSRDVARSRKPVEKEERFPGEQGRRSYRMLLLPFASLSGQCDHILCHLLRVE